MNPDYTSLINMLLQQKQQQSQPGLQDMVSQMNQKTSQDSNQGRDFLQQSNQGMQQGNEMSQQGLIPQGNGSQFAPERPQNTGLIGNFIHSIVGGVGNAVGGSQAASSGGGASSGLLGSLIGMFL